MAYLSLRTTPLRRITRVTLLTNSEIQCWCVLSATVTDSGDGLTGFYHVTRRLEQRLVVTVKTQKTVAVVEDHQQPGTSQPIGKHHAAAVNGMHLAAGGGADHHAVPFGAGIVATAFTEARQQSTINRPWKFAAGGSKGAAKGFA